MPHKIDIVVINDLVTDNRVHKVALALQDMGFHVRLTGRRLRKSQPLAPRPYDTHRMWLLFEKGPLFYAEFNLRLFFRLLFSASDIILANDLDTLLASYLASKLRGKKLVYDSHEYFTEVPELIDRPVTQGIWKKIEKAILPKIKNAYTVSESIAQVYSEKYGTPFRVVRNMPFRTDNVDLPDDKKIEKNGDKVIIYQGALNLSRGLEAAIKAMQYLDHAQLWLAGDGDLTAELQKLTEELGLEKKIRFLGRVALQDMKYYTVQADLGISIEEDRGLNYRFALPNKLFDYIQHGIPVLVSNLPEMKKIIDTYQIGTILNSHTPQEMATQFEHALFDDEDRKRWLANMKKAAETLCWEAEIPILQDIFKNAR